MVLSTRFSWKRLVNWGSPTADSPSLASAGEERRVAVRYACDVETLCQPAITLGSPRLSARVQDISRGGIKQLVNQPFQTGALLSVELPGVLVLACVVHVSQRPNGEWALGCTFSSELQDEDLQLFGAQPAPDRRTGVRFAFQTPITYRLMDAQELQARSAEVTDISTHGIGLVVTHPVAIGALLNLELRGTGEPEVLTMLACVVRITAEDNQTWILGCNFIRELTTDEVQSLL